MLSPSRAGISRSVVCARPAGLTSGARVTNARFVALLLLFGVVNVAAVLLWPRLMGDSLNGRTDWANLSQLSFTNPYANVFFRWSPPAAWIWIALIAPLGLALWTAMHFAALFFLRDWRVAALVLVSFPFWGDTLNGNALTFAFVSAWLALRGSPSGAITFIVLTALMPRPLMFPSLAWLVWHERRYLWLTLGAAVLVLISAVLSGQFEAFTLRLLFAGAMETVLSPWNVGPSALIGIAWIPIGLVLAIALTRARRLGLASLAASPYWLGYYLLFAFLELADLRGRPFGASASQELALSDRRSRQT